MIQQKCVDSAKKTNPEKTVSVYDIKFQKKWMDSCDEAEKIMIGKCAFRASTVTNTVCLILSLISGSIQERQMAGKKASYWIKH